MRLRSDGVGYPSIDFRGEQRCNVMHASAMHPDAPLHRVKEQEATLCYLVLQW
jgi:hypothetical protein